MSKHMEEDPVFVTIETDSADYKAGKTAALAGDRRDESKSDQWLYGWMDGSAERSDRQFGK